MEGWLKIRLGFSFTIEDDQLQFRFWGGEIFDRLPTSLVFKLQLNLFACIVEEEMVLRESSEF